MKNEAYVYIVRCQDGSLYTGMARCLSHRLWQHYSHDKGAAKYTKSHPIVALEAAWEASDRVAAAKLEYAVKTLTREQKLDLIAHPDMLDTVFGSRLSGAYRHLTVTLEECLAAEEA